MTINKSGRNCLKLGDKDWLSNKTVGLKMCI